MSKIKKKCVRIDSTRSFLPADGFSDLVGLVPLSIANSCTRVNGRIYTIELKMKTSKTLRFWN
jgi:hypothetical protein